MLNLTCQHMIEQVTTTVFRLPLHGELRWGKASALAEARHVYVEVTLSDGSRGCAEAPPRPTIYGETVHSITSVIEHELAPRIVGIPLPQVPARLQEVKNNHTAKGAVDMALHDSLAHSQGITLAAHLGAVSPKIQVSYILGIGDRATVLAEAQRVFDQGVRVLKVKVGRDWQEDLQRIRDLQAMFGNEMLLYADANEGFAPAEVRCKLAELRDLGLLYCEEPLPTELIRERADLRSEGVMPLIADDSCMTQRDLTRELAFGTFDVLNIKPARTGYTESCAMLEQTLAAGKRVMVGSQACVGLGTIRAAVLAARPGIHEPCELSFFLKTKADILDRPLIVKEGYLHLTDLLDARVDPVLLAAAR